eukprot:5394488-Prymnesium_polylepis.1
MAAPHAACLAPAGRAVHAVGVRAGGARGAHSLRPRRQRRCLRRRADVCLHPAVWKLCFVGSRRPPRVGCWADRPPRVDRPLGPVSQTSIPPSQTHT